MTQLTIICNEGGDLNISLSGEPGAMVYDLDSVRDGELKDLIYSLLRKANAHVNLGAK